MDARSPGQTSHPSYYMEASEVIAFSGKLSLYVAALSIAVLLTSLWFVDAQAVTKEERVKELNVIAEDLRKAITEQNTKRILRYVNKGISCIDAFVEIKEVERDLNDSKSALYERLFGSKGMRSYFQTAKNQRTRVDFMEVKGKEILDWVCLRYMSSNLGGEDWPEICLSYREGKWGIGDSLYNCL